MPLTIEDGTNVAAANSYATRVEIIAYAAARGIVITDVAGTDVHAIKAMDYIEVQSFKGEPTFDDQPLSWPRSGVVVGIVELDDESIPIGLINAQCEAAMQSFNGIDLMPTAAAEQTVKSEKIGGTSGAVEVEYFGPAPYSPTLPRLDALLKPLIVGSGFALNVIKA